MVLKCRVLHIFDHLSSRAYSPEDILLVICSVFLSWLKLSSIYNPKNGVLSTWVSLPKFKSILCSHLGFNWLVEKEMKFDLFVFKSRFPSSKNYFTPVRPINVVLTVNWVIDGRICTCTLRSVQCCNCAPLCLR